jgi:hypothetical protein
MGRLDRLNGWQRLWLVGTVLSLVAFAGFYPVFVWGGQKDYTFGWAIQKDYANPACAAFLTLPFDQLREPPFGDGGTCWHIYTTRHFEEGHKAYMTYEEWAAADNREFWSKVGMVSVAMAAVVAVLSGLVYAAGKIVGWVIRGFRRPA